MPDKLRTTDRDRPWFTWLSFPDPHNPYIAPEPFASLYDPDAMVLPPYDQGETWDEAAS